MRFSHVIIIFLTYFVSCTPKVSQKASDPIATPSPPTPTQEVATGPCTTFDQSGDKEQALNAHVIYRDYMRESNYEEAYPYWQRAYSLAPAADGKRNTHYADGIKFYEHFLTTTTDEQRRESLIDTIFMFYDQIEECYSQAAGYVSGRKAFDMYYKYKDRGTKEEIYQLFTKSLDTDGMDANFFILNPFTDLLVRRLQNDEISLTEAQKYGALITQRLEKGLASGKNQSQWQIIKEYVPQRLEAFEGVRGFYDCTYYTEKYYPDFVKDSSNCEVIEEIYSKLRWGGCDSNQVELEIVAGAARRYCSRRVEASDAKKAYEALREARYEEAIALFETAAQDAEDIEKKANYTFIIAKIYNAHLKDFPSARKYALQAAAIRENWGEPFVLIGRLYASSGPLCGPGRGWDSQIVVWPAIDKWTYAKRIDPNVTGEANKWISRYSQYMPSKEDVFQRNLKQGQSFRVGCWIQENTTIRSPG